MEHRQYYTFEEQELRRATWIWGLLSYGLPFSLIPAFLFTHKNKFIHYHAKQGVVQFAFFLLFFLFLFLPKIGEILFLLSMLLQFSISVTGIVLYFQKEIFEFPVIGSLARRLKLN
ncbi:MAG TPA: hypothetical protein PLV02_01145 [Candidatus Mcinerneyibacteriales bacterium]|nr:hypothetical protein [Candidatus Mcinerneyibacteriales bacterium]